MPVTPVVDTVHFIPSPGYVVLDTTDLEPNWLDEYASGELVRGGLQHKKHGIAFVWTASLPKAEQLAARLTLDGASQLFVTDQRQSAVGHAKQMLRARGVQL
jgi:hypothetical protein